MVKGAMRHWGTLGASLALGMTTAWPLALTAQSLPADPGEGSRGSAQDISSPRPDCSTILPAAPVAAPGSRGIRPDDLLRLRDIGPRNRAPSDVFAGLSPDRQQLAFILTRDDPVSNVQCRALVTIGIAPGSRIRILDSGGEPVNEMVNMRGSLIDYGYPALNRPLWSPDGRNLAYLRRDAGVTRLWVVSTAGGDAHPVSHALLDVESFAWNGDGSALIYGTRAGLTAARARIAREGLSGYLYDQRTIPYDSLVPQVAMPVPYHYRTVELASLDEHPASDAERALAEPPPTADTIGFYLHQAQGGENRRAWTAQDDPTHFMSAVHLWAEDGRGHVLACPDRVCTGTIINAMTNLWWSADGREVLFLRHTGPGGSQIALFAWRVGTGHVRRILATEDSLSGCQLAGYALLCAREGSLMPRRLVAIDVKTGMSRTLFDPNPEFGALRLGSVERLHWVNAYGLPSFGDLVLPPGYKEGAGAAKLPLIVVQYDTRGFLRGGTGDEYPIQLFAARGFAVLSVQMPPVYYSSLPDGGWRSWQEAERENTRDFHERKSNLSSLVTGLHMVLARGLVDPARVGITGLSDGASSVQFALVNTRLFAAAAVSSAGTDSQSMIYGGEALAAVRKQQGWPAAGSRDPSYWQGVSLAFKTDGPRVPLLLQLADHEMLLGLEEYQTLRERRWPVELYSFAQEYHLKQQPAHRAAIYARNLAWFDFWLQGKASDDPAFADAMARWQRLKADAEAADRSDAKRGATGAGTG